MNASSASVRDFLHHQYGTTTGTAWLGSGTGRDHTETKFEWPHEADQMVRNILMADSEDDVWFSAHLSHNQDSRKKGDSVERLRIHADIDRALTSEDCLKIAQLQAWTVLSGSAGHVHVYVELDRGVSLEEYAKLEAALVFFLDADRSKVCDNDLLRIPGTSNHKQAPKGGPVRLDIPWKDARSWSPEELGQILPVATVIQQKVELITSGKIVPERVPVLPDGVAMSLDRLTGDRSDDTFAVVCEAAKAGLTIGQALGIVLSEPALARRYNEKGLQFRDAEMHRLWATATEKAETLNAERDCWSDLLPSGHRTTPTAERPPAAKRFKMFTMSDMARPRRMEWLAEGRIPKSATTILVGHEGIGKSLYWVCLAAILTNGWAAPHLGIAGGEPQHVVVVLNEDDVTTQVMPRLIAAGADFNYMHIICGDREGNDSPTFPDESAMQEIRDTVGELDVALIVIDTWMNTLRGVDIKDPVKARGALQPWTLLAQEFKTSVLLVTHTNRLNSKSTRDVMGGTSELRKAARSTLFAQLDDQKRLTVGVDKSNVAAATAASIFDQVFVPTYCTEEDGSQDYLGDFPALRYAGDADQTAQEILETVINPGDEDANEKKDCTRWMEDMFRKNGGSILSDDLERAGLASGFSKSMIGRTRRKLGVTPTKGADGKWIASL